ncbi:ABC transporter ATP-binding protein [uncultured Desulfovibrio sp.]|uniref:ABC transporter ATP-binding protein n=1 Tax=uncultured Desulfovibrio sp. TaxID=167968 RepID=UPI0026044894|nr:ABC transporter ATP-binding protein [uncultured Desulfovibrio sp.]
MKHVITARQLKKSYAGMGQVLKGVDLTVTPGEFVAVMGPSGCGKSTLLHLLGLLHSPDSGSLRMLDTDVLALAADEATMFRRDHVGFILQSNNIFSHTTVYENIEFPLACRAVPRPQRRGLVEAALAAVGLGHKMSAWGNSLSGGEQQRVAIARALVNKPRIVLADEPTGALDNANSRALMESFRHICQRDNVAIVMVTHDSGMARYCHTVYTLEDGVFV